MATAIALRLETNLLVNTTIGYVFSDDGAFFPALHKADTSKSREILLETIGSANIFLHILTVNKRGLNSYVLKCLPQLHMSIESVKLAIQHGRLDAAVMALNGRNMCKDMDYVCQAFDSAVVPPTQPSLMTEVKEADHAPNTATQSDGAPLIANDGAVARHITLGPNRLIAAKGPLSIAFFQDADILAGLADSLDRSGGNTSYMRTTTTIATHRMVSTIAILFRAGLVGGCSEDDNIEAAFLAAANIILNQVNPLATYAGIGGTRLTAVLKQLNYTKDIFSIDAMNTIETFLMRTSAQFAATFSGKYVRIVPEYRRPTANGYIAVPAPGRQWETERRQRILDLAEDERTTPFFQIDQYANEQCDALLSIAPGRQCFVRILQLAAIPVAFGIVVTGYTIMCIHTPIAAVFVILFAFPLAIQLFAATLMILHRCLNAITQR